MTCTCIDGDGQLKPVFRCDVHMLDRDDDDDEQLKEVFRCDMHMR